MEHWQRMPRQVLESRPGHGFGYSALTAGPSGPRGPFVTSTILWFCDPDINVAFHFLWFQDINFGLNPVRPLTLPQDISQHTSYSGLEPSVKHNKANSALMVNCHLKLWPSDLNLHSSPTQGVSTVEHYSTLRRRTVNSSPLWGPKGWTSPKTNHSIPCPFLCPPLLLVLWCLQEWRISLVL